MRECLSCVSQAGAVLSRVATLSASFHGDPWGVGGGFWGGEVLKAVRLINSCEGVVKQGMSS